MGNCIHTFFGDRLSAGHAVPERAISDPSESRLYHPDLQQSGIAKTLQNLVAFTLRSTFLDICIGWLIELRLDPQQARVKVTQTIAQANLELANVFHRLYPQRCPDLPVAAPGVVSQFILCRAPFALPICSLRSAFRPVPVRPAWPVARPAALRSSAAAFSRGGGGRRGAFLGATVRLEEEETNHRERDHRDNGDYDVLVVHRISPHPSSGELQRTPTASRAI
jgi:hypothetical protein